MKHFQEEDLHLRSSESDMPEDVLPDEEVEQIMADKYFRRQKLVEGIDLFLDPVRHVPN